MIEIKNVSKSFGKHNVLRNVSFNIHKGQVLGIIGANGSGKTTLLKLILGLISTDEGEIKVGFNKGSNKIGFVSEEGGLMQDFKVKNYLKYFCILQGLHNDSIDNALSYFKLGNLKNKKIKKLSNGQKKKVDITQALLSKPKLLIMDEPTNGLDYHTIMDLREFIKDFSDNDNSVIITSHYLTELEKIGDHFLFIDKGEIKGLHSKNEIQSKFGNIENAYKECIRLE